MHGTNVAVPHNTQREKPPPRRSNHGAKGTWNCCLLREKCGTRDGLDVLRFLRSLSVVRVEVHNTPPDAAHQLTYQTKPRKTQIASSKVKLAWLHNASPRSRRVAQGALLPACTYRPSEVEYRMLSLATMRRACLDSSGSTADQLKIPNVPRPSYFHAAHQRDTSCNIL